MGSARTKKSRSRLQYIERERRALLTGEWGPWEKAPHAPPVGAGWLSEITEAFHNRAFAVLVREVPTEWGSIEHAAIRNISNTDIAWRDMQRIKNELFGANRVAVEVFPPTHELIDEAGMYHLWVLPPGFVLPFTLVGHGHRLRPSSPLPEEGRDRAPSQGEGAE